MTKKRNPAYVLHVTHTEYIYFHRNVVFPSSLREPFVFRCCHVSVYRNQRETIGLSVCIVTSRKYFAVEQINTGPFDVIENVFRLVRNGSVSSH